jgi:hypothetical protein
MQDRRGVDSGVEIEASMECENGLKDSDKTETGLKPYLMLSQVKARLMDIAS